MSNLAERSSLPVGILNKGSTWALLVHHPPALESSKPLPICASNKHFSSLLPTSLLCISGLNMANSNMIALTKLLPPRSHHSLNPQSERYTKEKYIRHGDVLSKETIPSVCFWRIQSGGHNIQCGIWIQYIVHIAPLCLGTNNENDNTEELNRSKKLEDHKKRWIRGIP